MSTALNTAEARDLTGLEGLPSSTISHKLIAKYDESLSRKVWVVACGLPLEGARIKQQWSCVSCAECRKHKRKGIKRINIQELLAGVSA